LNLSHYSLKILILRVHVQCPVFHCFDLDLFNELVEPVHKSSLKDLLGYPVTEILKLKTHWRGRIIRAGLLRGLFFQGGTKFIWV